MVAGRSEPLSTLTDLIEDLDARHEGGEGLQLEFKRATGGLPKSPWETISAFANTRGGWVLLGVDEAQDPPCAEGVPNVSGMLQDFWNQMGNRQRISVVACGATDAWVKVVDGKDVIVIRVPAASRKSRPVHVGREAYGGTFVRRGSGDCRCDKAEVDRMMREASDDAADATILNGYSWDDLDQTTFAGYRRRFQTAHPGHPTNNYSDDQFLEAVNGYRKDRDRGTAGITVAGLLMFGRPAAIRDWRSRHLFDFRVLPKGIDSAADWDDRYTWEGNLLGAFDTIYPRLVERLPVPFRLDGPLRVDATPAHVALREALVNLLVHADYGETLASLVFRMPDAYFFENPGASRVPDVGYVGGRHSDPRNPNLVFMFRQIALAEEAGSGVPRIIQAWRELGYRAPQWHTGADDYRFSLLLRHVDLISDADRTWLDAVGEELDEAARLALLVARGDGNVDNARLRSLSGQHPTDATRTLVGLRDRGLLQMIGIGRGARYELTGRSPDMHGNGPDMHGNGPDMHGNGPDMHGNGPDMHGNGERDGDERPDGRRLAPGRLAPADMEAAVLAACAGAWLTRAEIASVVSRNPLTLRETLSRLVGQGRLVREFPDHPTRPGQRYRAAGPAPECV